MATIITDKLTFDAPRRTKEGYMAVRARAARSGVYDYLGAEVDPTGTKFRANDTIKVYRPEDEVFDKRSIQSFIMRPITNDHPTEAVTADNWRDLAKGVVAGAVRDGEYLAFDLVFMDGETVRDIETGKRELSNGYSVDLSFEDGIAPDGTAYQAVQRNIVGNHVALVDAGRAGPSCAIPACDAINPDTVNRIMVELGDKTVTTKPVTITIDGKSHVVDLSDAAAILVGNLQTALDAAATSLATANTKIGELTATISTKDGEIAALTKRATDAEAVDLDKVAADRAALIDAAKKIFPAIDAKGKSASDIRKLTVEHKLGDAAKNMDDNAVSGAFAALSASIKVDTANPLTDAIVSADNTSVNDKSRQSYLDRLTRKTAA